MTISEHARRAADNLWDSQYSIVTYHHIIQQAIDAATEKLNQMLRETGYGQGQIDAYAALAEEVERLRAELADARRQIDLTHQPAANYEVLVDWVQGKPALPAPGCPVAVEIKRLRAENATMRAELLEISAELKCRCDPCWTDRGLHAPECFNYLSKSAAEAAKEKQK
jgi:hypothetical protein